MTPPEPMDTPIQWFYLFIMSISIISGMSTWFSASAILPQLILKWELSEQTSPLLTVLVQIGFVVGALIISVFQISDLFQAKYIMVVGCVGAGLANVLIIAWEEFAFALCMRFFTGMFLACVYPPSLRLTSTWFKNRRGLALGVMVGSVTLGSAMPHLLKAVEAQYDWSILMITTTALTWFGGAVILLIVKEGPFTFPKAKFDIKAVIELSSDPGWYLPTGAYLGHMWELYACWSWCSQFFLNTLNQHSDGDSSDHSGKSSLITFAVVGTGFFGCVFGGLISDKFGRVQLCLLSLVVSGLCSAFIGIAAEESVSFATVIGIIWGFFVVADSAQFSTMITELVSNKSIVGSSLTVQTGLGFMLTCITIYLVPVIHKDVGWVYAFSFLSIGPVVGIFALISLYKRTNTTTIS
eukprot:TRINITY_DN6768_c0_g1_i1.p1 TRINITY_DN6768_c0_g1~~TRINITY_DN6768_c0_g1_i1.p1  ORF type:complete len:410 (-),score=31.57 TRINITY_DN6768_c0_g1_i1:83-1312(-)